MWVAHIVGLGLEGGKVCAGGSEADEFLERAFSQMFPEHECGSRCAPASRYADQVSFRPD